MAILKKDKYKKQVIDLTGPDGNAFFLLGTAMKLCKEDILHCNGLWRKYEQVL